VLDLDHPESRKVIEACFLIEELSSCYPDILKLQGTELDSLFGGCRLKLGKLGLLADELLSEERSELANKNVQLLYKALTGQVSITEKDFDKIDGLLNQLSNKCFSCWCI